MIADKKKRAAEIVRRLKKTYPDAHCALNHTSPFELFMTQSPCAIGRNRRDYITSHERLASVSVWRCPISDETRRKSRSVKGPDADAENEAVAALGTKVLTQGVRWIGFGSCGEGA